MKTIEDTIYVEPTPEGRPRMSVIGGHAHAYTPKKTRTAQADIKATIRNEVMKQGRFDDGVPLSLSAIFYIVKPKSSPKRVTMPVKKPDLDNYGKLLLDALNKFVWSDDSQIVDLHIRKRFSQTPYIWLKISEVLE